MKSRFELSYIFSAFYSEIRTQYNYNVHILRSDNAKKYFSDQFNTNMTQNGIIYESSYVVIPQQKEIVERKNRHFMEVARALMFQIRVPKMFWADTVHIATFLINRMLSSVLNGCAPYTVLFSIRSLFFIPPKIFGCTCFVQDMRSQISKLDPRSLKCIFFGYFRTQKGYRCYSSVLGRYLCLEMSPSLNRVLSL